MNEQNLQQDFQNKIDCLQKDLANKTKEIEFLKSDHNCNSIHAGNSAKPDENALMQDLQFCKHILNSVTEAIYILNSNWEFLCVNKGAEIMYGYSHEELIGKTLLSLAAPNKNNIPQLLEHLEDVLKNGGTKSFEFCGLRKNKDLLFKEVILTHGYNKNEDVVIATAREITQKKKAEQELLKFKSISDNAVHGNAIIDIDGTILYCNNYFATTHGYKSSEVVGKNVSIFHAEKQLKSVKKLNEGLLKNGSYQSKEVWHSHKNGTEFPMLMNGIVIYNEQKEPIYLAATAIDITEAKRVQNQLGESEEKFRAIFENAPLLIDAFDKNGKCVLWNKTCEKTFGWTIDDLNNVEDSALLFYPNKEVYNKVKKAIHTEPKGSFQEWNPLTKDGRTLNTLWANFRISNGLIINLGYDITETRKIENNLKASEAKFKAVMKQAPFVWELYNLNGLQIEVNTAFEDLWGVSAETTLNKFNILKSQKVERADLMQYVKRAYAGEVVSVPEYSYSFTGETETKGKVRWLSTRIYPIKDDNAKVTNIVITHQDITVRKRTEEERDRIFNLSVDMICTASLNDGYLHQVNPAWEQNLGWTLEELRSKPFFDFIHPDDLEQAAITVASLTQGKSVLGFESRYLAKDGSYKWLSWNTIPIPNENTMLGIVRDITKQKQAADKLVQSEEKFRALYDNAPLAYQSLGEDGVILDINPSWCTLLGYDRKEVIGKKYVHFLHPEWRAHFAANFEVFKEKGYARDVRFRLRHKKGHFVDISLEGCIGFNPDGTFKQTYSVFKDITAETKTQTELRESEEKFRSIFDESPIGIELFDGTGKLLNINKASCNMFGILNMEVVEHFNLFDGTSLTTELKDQLRNGNSIEYTADIDFDKIKALKLYETSAEGVATFDYRITPLKGADNTRVEGYLMQILDITHQKKAEKELIRAKERAEESDRLKSAFLANMSHEIRTPMNGILGFTDLLDQPSLSSEQQKEYVDIIKESGVRMLSTVNDIIDISKIDARQVSLDKTKVNLTQQIDSLYSFFKPEAQKKGLELKLRSELSTNNLVLETDKGKFISILTNLIKNAIKYTDKGEIEVGVSIEKNNLRCWVKDTGIGIPENRKQAVFNRFEQADIEDSYAREGSGLGLAIAKSYAQMLNGDIQLESKEGVGSIFYFTMPAVEVLSHKLKQKMSGVAKIQARKEQLNILIAEDDDISFAHLEIILRKVAKNIIRAKNGIEVLDLVKNDSALDCILLDVKMPLMDGYTACRKIREFNSEVIIIAQTAYALEKENEKALAAGCNDYISKPIRRELLFEMLEKHVKTKE